MTTTAVFFDFTNEHFVGEHESEKDQFRCTISDVV